MTEPSDRERWVSPFEELAEGSTPGETRDAGGGEQVVGTPDEDASVWDGVQSYPDTCAIRCQEFILEQYTGQEIDETALVEQAQANGWYQPGMGTAPQDVGNLLEANGVPINRYQDATTYDLANELAQGHKVVLGVDSGELIDQENPVLESILSIAGFDGPDHAVVISGIDTTDPDNPQVIVSDPGTGEAEATYPLEQFLAAWQDSDFHMVATQQPPPEDRQPPEMENFDYDAGHIPEVLGIPYQDFAAMQDPSAWNDLLEQVPQGTNYMPDTTSGPVEPGGTVPDPGVPDPNALDIDPSLLDPTAPGPTLSPSLFDPNAPGPTLDPNLLNPTTPGPTLSPDLLDPSAPGPTVDPNLLDPSAPGPTLSPSLLDPSAPGPTIDPNMLDPLAPGPTIDRSMLDPSASGTAVYPSWFVDKVADIQQDIDQTDQEIREDWADSFDTFNTDPDDSSSGSDPAE